MVSSASSRPPSTLSFLFWAPILTTTRFLTLEGKLQGHGEGVTVIITLILTYSLSKYLDMCTNQRRGFKSLGRNISGYLWIQCWVISNNWILATYKFRIYSQKTFLTTWAHLIPRLFCQKTLIYIFLLLKMPKSSKYSKVLLLSGNSVVSCCKEEERAFL